MEHLVVVALRMRVTLDTKAEGAVGSSLGIERMLITGNEC